MARRFGKMLGVALLAAVACVGIAKATVPYIPSSPTYSEASQIVATLNYLIGLINTNINTQTLAQFAAPRNLIDNGQMQVQQRGTGTRTCGTTTIPSTAYSADRWGCNVNVTSGAGTLQVITTNLPAAPLPAFNAAELFYRTSGALAQPQCVMQEIPTTRVTNMQGQNMVLSAYIQGLALMLAEQTTVNAYVFTGTGSDEGLQSFTASPAVTPAFTGIASTLTTAWTITSSWARYSYSFTMPTTATEAAVALCWTPTTGGTAGATDGFRFTGVELEQSSSGVASGFEFRPYVDELKTAQSYYAQWSDAPAATFTLPGTCTEYTSGTAAACELMLPTTMVKVPAVVVATATSFGMTKAADGTAGACSTLATVASSGNANSIKLTCALSETAAVGTMHIMLYAATGAANTITASADF